LCRFQSFDLAQVPAAKREQALKLELERWSPYLVSGYYIAWSGDSALVWCWDDERVQRALAASKVNPRRLSVVPETLLHPPQAKGLRLMRCLEGYEAQLWDDHRLVQSRWWPALPAAMEWLAFQRDASLPSDQQTGTVPSPVAQPLQAHPWVRAVGMDVHGQRTRLVERLALGLGILTLALPTLWYGLGMIKLQQAHDQLDARIGQLDRRARPILVARSQALDEIARIQALRRLYLRPDPLVLMAKVAEILPRNDAHIKEWKYQDGKLKLTIAASAPLSTIYLVEAFQKVGYFDGVRALASHEPTSVSLEMDVRATGKDV